MHRRPRRDRRSIVDVLFAALAVALLVASIGLGVVGSMVIPGGSLVPAHPAALSLPRALARLHRFNEAVARDASATLNRAIHHRWGLPLHARHTLALSAPMPMVLPASVDLSAHAPPAGNQGALSSCTAWASAYSIGGTLDDGIAFNPLPTYTRVAHGQNVGLDPADVLQDEAITGMVPLTATDITTATLTTWEPIYDADAAQGNAQDAQATPDPVDAIKSALAMGHPVLLGVEATPQLENATASAPVVDAGANDTVLGGHAVAALRYDQTGVWILNSWGTHWGLNGWGLLTWNFIRAHLIVAYQIDGVSVRHTTTPQTMTPAPSAPTTSRAP